VRLISFLVLDDGPSLTAASQGERLVLILSPLFSPHCLIIAFPPPLPNHPAPIGNGNRGHVDTI